MPDERKWKDAASFIAGNYRGDMARYSRARVAAERDGEMELHDAFDEIIGALDKIVAILEKYANG